MALEPALSFDVEEEELFEMTQSLISFDVSHSGGPPPTTHTHTHAVGSLRMMVVTGL